MNQPKAILLANIGTSDLAVKIDDYYYPIGFDRDEPHLTEKLNKLEPNKKQAWTQIDEIIATKLCSQLGVKVTKNEDKKNQKIFYKYSFRELTRKILDNYQDWDSKIIPGRIWGVIQEAYDRFKIDKIYIFVTDQDSPKYKEQDSVQLFEIIKKWFEKRLPKLEFHARNIPKSVSPVETDRLLPYYFDTLNEIIKENDLSEVLVSIKGGTPQMQNALQIQVMSSAIKNQIFLKPTLEPDQVLDGKKSKCGITCYWRSIQKQKFDTVKTLIQKRWDFDGAREIVKDWSESLEFFKANVPDERESIIREERSLSQIIKDLTFAIDCFNLDKNTSSEGSEIQRWLNLYTQCRIYWQLDEVANFLTRLGSFYEETLHDLIRQLDGEKYFKDGNKDSKWRVLNPQKKSVNLTNKPIIKEHPLNGEQAQIWEELAELETQMGGYEVTWTSSSSNDISLKVQGKFKTADSQALGELGKILTGNKIYSRNHYKLSSRYSKRNFVEALVNIRYSSQKDYWNNILSSLEKLDYWCEQRNNLIHSAKGMSKQTMKTQLQEDRDNWNEEDENDRYKANPHQACDVDNIVEEMTNIGRNVNELLARCSLAPASNDCIGSDDRTPYYIYSEVLEKILKELS